MLTDLKRVVVISIAIVVFMAMFSFVSTYEASAATKGAVSKVENSADGITVSWTKDTSKSGYVVYRKAGSSDWKKVKKVTSGRTASWKDENVKNGTKYSYKVYPYKGSRTYKNSASKSIYRLSKPSMKLQTGVDAAGAIKITSGTNSAATGYRITYSTKSSFASPKTKYVSGNSIDYTLAGLTPEKIYYVKIRSYRTVGSAKQYSAYSSKAKVRSSKVPTPKIKVENCTDCIQVTWDEIKGATAYKVYRKTGSESYELKKTVKKGQALSYKNTSYTGGRTYTYKVVAYKGSYKSSGAVKKMMRLYTPTLTLAQEGSSMAVTWTESKGAEGYKVYLVSDSGEYTAVKTVAASAERKYVGDPVPCNTKVRYSVRAISGQYGSAYKTNAKYRTVKHKYETVYYSSSNSHEFRGYTRQVCSLCDAKLKNSKEYCYDVTPHKWSGWTNTGSSEKMKYQQRTCVDCGKVVYRPNPADYADNPIISEALKHMGEPYILYYYSEYAKYNPKGYENKTGIDCSHFIYGLLKDLGMDVKTMYPDAWSALKYDVPKSYDWVNFGRKVAGPGDDIDSIAQPGDIISLNGHVAIYMGDGDVIHATTSNPFDKTISRGVQIWNLGSLSEFVNYYENRASNPRKFIGITRFLPDVQKPEPANPADNESAEDNTDNNMIEEVEPPVADVLDEGQAMEEESINILEEEE